MHSIFVHISSRYTYQYAFKKILSEVDDYAGQHEGISETLQDSIFKDMHLLVNESKSERRKVSIYRFYIRSYVI